MTSEPAAQAGRPPDDPDQLKTEIEQTRQQLGDTVDQLAAKADVKARAQAKVADAKTKVADVTERARNKTSQIRQQAATAGGTGREQLQRRTPDPVKRAVGQGAESARRYRTQLAIATGAVVVGILVVRWWKRR
jgi:cell division septum initiation protein DivIVA